MSNWFFKKFRRGRNGRRIKEEVTIFLIFFLFSQTLRWAYCYNGPANNVDEAYSIVYGLDNNIYAVGWSEGRYARDFTVISITADGRERWVYRYDGPGNWDDYGWDIAYGLDNNIYAAGWSWGTCDDITVISITSDGRERWVYRYDGPANFYDLAHSIVYGLDNNIYVTGGIWDTTTPNFVVISLDTNGNERWFYRSRAGTGGWDIVYGLDNNIYAGGGGFTVISLDTNGNERWVYRYNNDEVRSIAYGLDNNIYAAGRSYYDSITRYDITVISLDTNGNERWFYRYCNVGSRDYAFSIAYGLDNNIYVAGVVYDSITRYDIVVISLDRDGNERWVYRYNQPGNFSEYALSIAYGLDNNIYVAGQTSGIFTIISLDTNGRERWIYRYFTPPDHHVPSSGLAYSIVYGLDNNIYAGGYIRGYYTSCDFTVISLNPEVGIKEKVRGEKILSTPYKAKEIYDITGKKIKDLRRIKKGIYFFKDKYFKKVIILN